MAFVTSFVDKLDCVVGNEEIAFQQRTGMAVWTYSSESFQRESCETHSCATHNPNYCKLNQSYTLATEGCQVGQERIYLNITKVSLAQLPGGDMERVCLWLFCPRRLCHMRSEQ